MFETKEEELFCEIGQSLGFLTLDQVNVALDEQKIDLATGVQKPIGAYLLEKNFLTREQIGHILKNQKQLREKTPSLEDSPKNQPVHNNNAITNGRYELIHSKCKEFYNGISGTFGHEEEKTFVAPHFHLCRLEKAISCYAFGLKVEEVILHWDHSVMGGGETGFLITSEAIYWQTTIGGSARKLDLSSIKSIKKELGFIYSQIVINENKDLTLITGNSRKFCELVADFLLGLGELSRSIK